MQPIVTLRGIDIPYKEVCFESNCYAYVARKVRQRLCHNDFILKYQQPEVEFVALTGLTVVTLAHQLYMIEKL